MKKIIALSFLASSLLATGAWANCGDAAAANTDQTSMSMSAADSAGLNKTTLNVKGMMCASCSNKIKAKLLKVEGVKAVEIDTKLDTATVAYEGKIAGETLIKAVEAAGFKASL